MDPDSIVLSIIFVLAVVLSAIFRAFSEAFVNLDDDVIEEMADVDAKKAKALEKIDASKNIFSHRAKPLRRFLTLLLLRFILPTPPPCFWFGFCRSLTI